MSILITGAQMGNKGAQSMLFITVDEMHKRFPDEELIYLTDQEYDEKQFKFTKCMCNYYTKKIATLDGYKKYALITFSFFRDVIRKLAGKKKCLWHYRDLDRIADSINCILDISGFAIGNQWSAKTQESYIDSIRLAKKYHIPIYLLPQSFGPFEYSKREQYIVNDLQKWLTYPRIIFAREKSSLDELHKIGIKEAVLSNDLVLQNQGVDLNRIYINAPVINLPSLPECNNVGIIPNKQCFVFGNREVILSLYHLIIDQLLSENKNVIVFSHSKDDIPVCRDIKNLYVKDSRVKLISDELSCLEYDEFIKKFDYIICSRFHGVVHGYRNCIPAIILGWADKYNALSESVDQAYYSFDIRGSNLDMDRLKAALEKMEKNYLEEKRIISERVMDIQQDNCFDMIQKDLESTINTKRAINE